MSTQYPYFIQAALDDLKKNYGIDASPKQKSKPLVKWGENFDMSIDVPATIWSSPAAFESYQTGNTITHIVSESAADVGKVIQYEGHTLGLDAAGNDSLTFHVNTVTLNGQTPVALAVPLARANRSFLKGLRGDALAGRVSVMSSSAATLGVPDDPATVHLTIEPGFTQSLKGASSISANDVFIIFGTVGAVLKKTSASVDFIFEHAHINENFRQYVPLTGSTGGGEARVDIPPYRVIPPNSDFRMIGTSNANLTAAETVIFGILASVL